MCPRLALLRTSPSRDPFAPHPGLFFEAVGVRTREALFSRFALALARDGVVTRADALLETLALRERAETTAVGFGIAVPHARSVEVTTTAVACARLVSPLDLGAPDAFPVELALLVVAPYGLTGALFMPLLAAILSVVREHESRRRLLQVANADSFSAWLATSLKPLVMEALCR